MLNHKPLHVRHEQHLVKHAVGQHQQLPFFFNDTPTTDIYTLSLHDALPICSRRRPSTDRCGSTSCSRSDATAPRPWTQGPHCRSEEHTSELQSRRDLVCRLLLEKKKTSILM